MPINSFENYPMSWKPNLSGAQSPIYKALAQKLEEDILSGTLHPGDLLPPQRELADYLDLNLSTISKAFKLCSQKGLICSSMGKGTYVASDAQVNSTLLDPQKANGLIELGAIHPDSTLNNYFSEAMLSFMKNKNALDLFNYNDPFGTLYQKKTGVKWLGYTGVNSSPENILLSNGGQNALCAILSSLFHPGDRIGTDPLVFSGIKTLAKLHHIQLIPIPFDQNAMSPELLDQYCKTEGLQGIYLIPDFQNPTTHSMSLKRRSELATVAKKHHLIVIEDAINSLFIEQPPTAIASLLPEQTVYVSSLSKVICPGIQIAFIHTPLVYKTTLENGLYNTNLMVSPINAEFACHLIHSSSCLSLLAKRRELTILRNQLVDSILGDYTLHGLPECNFRFLELPQSFNGKQFEARARNVGIQVYCGERFAVGNTTVPPAIRLAITSPKTLSELEHALYTLRGLLSMQPSS